jgi:hypothetical protein
VEEGSGTVSCVLNRSVLVSPSDIAQEELEAKRKSKEEARQAAGGKSLFETLQANKGEASKLCIVEWDGSSHVRLLPTLVAKEEAFAEVREAHILFCLTSPLIAFTRPTASRINSVP